MPTATLTSKGQITIPKAVRELLGVDAGDQIDFVVTSGGDVFVRSVNLDIRDLKGFLKRSRSRAVSVEEMNGAVLRHHARKR